MTAFWFLTVFWSLSAMLLAVWIDRLRTRLRAEFRLRVDAETYAQYLERQLLQVRGMAGAAPTENTAAAVRRLVVRARGDGDRKRWS